jgi:hypothetical protein
METARRADLEATFIDCLRPPPGSVRLSPASFAAFTDQDLRSWIARLQKLRSECGCSFGIRFSAAALLGTTALVAGSLRSGIGLRGVALEGGAGLAATVPGGGVGKIIGIAHARAQLRTVRRRLLTDIR